MQSSLRARSCGVCVLIGADGAGAEASLPPQPVRPRATALAARTRAVLYSQPQVRTSPPTPQCGSTASIRSPRYASSDRPLSACPAECRDAGAHSWHATRHGPCPRRLKRRNQGKARSRQASFRRRVPSGAGDCAVSGRKERLHPCFRGGGTGQDRRTHSPPGRLSGASMVVGERLVGLPLDLHGSA